MGTIQDYLKNKTIFITGATGFLGQPLVEKLLWAAPELKRIYVLIRPKKQFGGRTLTAQERLRKELFGSSVFDRLQAKLQDEFEPFLEEKLMAVPGDISSDGFGLGPGRLSELQSEVDIVINSAAVVSFDAPLNDSLELNVFGAKRVADFAAGCREASLIHVSTAYVCGAATGLVPETLHHSADPGTTEAFPVRQFQDVDREISTIQEIIARVESEAESRERRREFIGELARKLRRRRGRKRLQRKEEFENIRQRWKVDRLSEEGMEWARKRGWNDTYTYTKALGEQFVCRCRDALPISIIRPSVIESSLSEPSPGWLDGLRMADPLIVAIGKGRLRALPLNPDVSLDLIPADMVVNAILAAIPKTRDRGEVGLYQVATSALNPITLGELYELIFKFFRSNPMLDRDGNPIQLKPLKFPKPSTFRLHHRLKSMPLKTAEMTLERLPGFDATQKAKRRVAATKVAHDKLFYYGELYEPYLNLNCRFEVDRSLELFNGLSEEEQRDFNFDMRRLNWRHYIQNVHIPGVKKYILKIEGRGTLELAEETALKGRTPGTIRELLDISVAEHPAKIALQVKRDQEWVRYTYRDVQRRADEIALRLLAMGLRKGDRVVLFSENQPEWGIAYLGASTIGLVVVPLDAQTWHREVWSVAEFTESHALVVSPRCRERLTKEALARNERSERPRLILNVVDFCRPFEQAEQLESGVGTGGSDVRLPEVRPEDEASIIFTSGTAVDPKGAVHTHRNFLNNLLGVNHYLAISDQDHLLSVLPLYHALEFSCGFLMPLWEGATVTYCHSLKPRVILELMRETGTTCLLGVPTLYALIRDDIERRVLKTSKSPLKSNLLKSSKQLSRSVNRTFGRNIGKQVFSKVHEEVGGKIRFFVSGGSALGEQLYRDFNTLGMPIYEGYGLTETAPVLTVNPLHRSREGSAGKPLPGVELSLYHPDGDGVGEIIVKTPSLMKGYFKNRPATDAVIKGGWFHTGDLGWIDADGYVYITGRIKDVIVTGAGKNVYPKDLEAIYETIPEIEEICVLGIKSGLTEDVHAVIYPAAEARQLQPQEIKKLLQKKIQELARELPSYNRLQTLHVWEKPLPRKERDYDRVAIRKRVDKRSEREEKADITAGGRKEALYRELSRLSGVELSEIAEDTNLYSELGLDSLMALEFLLFLERELGVTVPDEQVTKYETVGDVLDDLRRLTLAEHRSAPTEGERIRSVLPYEARPISDRVAMNVSLTTMKALFRSYFDLSVENEERLPREGAFIVAANHSSHLDTAAVLSALNLAFGLKFARRLHVIGASDYFFNSQVKGWIFSTLLNVVPIERDEVSLAGLRRIRSILSRGEPILLFPEGTRSRSGELQAFRPGIGLISFEVGVPVVPAFIEGAYDALPAGKSVPSRGRIKVRFGEPIEAGQYQFDESAEANRDEIYRRIAADVQEAVRRLATGP